MKVIRGFQRSGGWPHAQVNVYVFESLQPLLGKIEDAYAASGKSAAFVKQLGGKPMIHIYNTANSAETDIFVSRGQMIKLGLWSDQLAVQGMLAHEHAHPLAENPCTRAARKTGVALKVDGPPEDFHPADLETIRQALERIVNELCLHAPHEIFTNELAARSGFAEALLHLNKLSLSEGRGGLGERQILIEKLRVEGQAGRIGPAAPALLALLASMEAHLRFVLESAGLARAGDLHRAAELDAYMEEQVLRHIEPEVGDMYRPLREHCAALLPKFTIPEVQEWMSTAFELLAGPVRKLGISCTMQLVAEGDSQCGRSSNQG